MVKRIALLTAVMTRGYGVSRVVHEQATRLCFKGIAVDVFTIRHEKNSFGAEPYRTLRLPYRPFLLKRYLQSDTYDVIIAHTEPFYSMLPFGSTKTVYYEHGVSPKTEGDKAIIDQQIITHRKTTATKADHTVTVSNYLKRAFGLEQAAVIPNSGSHIIRESSSKRSNTLLYIGRLGRGEFTYKGLNDLLAIARSCGDRYKIVMAVKGSPKMAQPFRSAGIEVRYNCSNEEIGSLLSQSAALLALSRCESSDLPLLEALAAGTLPLALSGGAHGEFGGKVFETVEELTSFLLSTSPEKLIEAGEKESAQHKQRWQESVEQLIDLIGPGESSAKDHLSSSGLLKRGAIRLLWAPGVWLYDFLRTLFR